MKSIPADVLSIAFIDHDLCTRCGTCIGICPTQALSLDHAFFPKIDESLCIECGLCKAVCPGGEVRFAELEKTTFGKAAESSSFDGHVEQTFVGYAGNPAFRSGGAGGGAVTALAWHLLHSGQVDGCVVTRMNPQKPWLGEVFIARTWQDLLSSQQSKYIIIPVNTILQELSKLEGRFAVVALPCQIHGLRKLQQKNLSIARKIKVIIGLFCASSLEPLVAEEMLKIKGIPRDAIANFQFRGGRWPGRIRAILRDGGIKNLHYSNFKDGAINYLTYLYSPSRCQTCIDGSSELSDISVSDAWTRDNRGKYIYESQSRLLVRTPVGQATMTAAISAGDLIAEDVTQDVHYQTHRLHARKKGLTAYVRVERLRRAGVLTPSYDRGTPPIERIDVRTERIESMLMRWGRISALRLPLFKFLISRYGIPLITLRQKRKQKKYRRA
ncbi:MAG: hypothetical protein EHM72_03710 [Calditrichaeota bacterium]|nr:MAG: hypothetical protein EHM72_03710 [Calditrichota bacterium]